MTFFRGSVRLVQEPSALCVDFTAKFIFLLARLVHDAREVRKSQRRRAHFIVTFLLPVPSSNLAFPRPQDISANTAASNENHSSSVTAGASPRELGDWILPHLQPSMPETYAVCSEQKKIDQNGVRQIYQVGKSNSRARVFMVWQPELQESRKRRPGLLFDGYFEDLRSSDSVLAQGGTSFSRSPVVFQ